MNTFSIIAKLAVAAVATVSLQAAPASARDSRDGYDRRVTIINESGQTIMEVRGSPTSWGSFGRDLIPDFVIESGERARVNFDKGTRQCMYDLQVKLEDGNTVERFGVNVCRINSWTIED